MIRPKSKTETQILHGMFSTAGEGEGFPPPSLRLKHDRLFVQLRLGGVAILLGHFLKALALARILALAGVLLTLARGLTFTRIDAIAMHLRFIGGGSADRNDAKQKCGRRGNRRTRNRLSSQHESFLAVILRWGIRPFCPLS